MNMRFIDFIVVSTCSSRCTKLEEIARSYILQDVISHDHVCLMSTVC